MVDRLTPPQRVHARPSRVRVVMFQRVGNRRGGNLMRVGAGVRASLLRNHIPGDHTVAHPSHGCARGIKGGDSPGAPVQQNAPRPKRFPSPTATEEGKQVPLVEGWQGWDCPLTGDFWWTMGWGN